MGERKIENSSIQSSVIISYGGLIDSSLGKRNWVANNGYEFQRFY